jgi:hypothetical protein
MHSTNKTGTLRKRSYDTTKGTGHQEDFPTHQHLAARPAAGSHECVTYWLELNAVRRLAAHKVWLKLAVIWPIHKLFPCLIAMSNPIVLA